MNERCRELLHRTAQIEAAPPDGRRREELAKRMIAAGHTREYADLIYDVASEEGVDPAVAVELVLMGAGVRDLGGPIRDHWEETQVEAAPGWLTDPVTGGEADVRERAMRTTFRRFKRLNDTSESTEVAIVRFVREPDVGAVDY